MQCHFHRAIISYRIKVYHLYLFGRLQTRFTRHMLICDDDKIRPHLPVALDRGLQPPFVMIYQL